MVMIIMLVVGIHCTVERVEVCVACNKASSHLSSDVQYFIAPMCGVSASHTPYSFMQSRFSCIGEISLQKYNEFSP